MNAFWMCVGSGPITFAYNSYYQRNIQNPKAKAQQVPKKHKECEAALVACKLKLTDTVWNSNVSVTSQSLSLYEFILWLYVYFC